jgi:hypothetical protein
MPHYDEEWISPSQLSMTASLAASTGHLQGEVIEVGVWQGRSAIPIAKAVAPALLHCVDHWLGDVPEAGDLGIEKEKLARDNYGQYLENLRDSGTENVLTWRMGWREFAKTWHKPIRFLHIDASHTTEEVADNIRALLPYAVPGGVFCGDDYTFPEVEAGVKQVFADPRGFERMWWVTI